MEDADRRGDITDAQLPVRQRRHDPESSRVPKRREEVCETGQRRAFRERRAGVAHRIVHVDAVETGG